MGWCLVAEPADADAVAGVVERLANDRLVLVDGEPAGEVRTGKVRQLVGVEVVAVALPQDGELGTRGCSGSIDADDVARIVDSQSAASRRGVGGFEHFDGVTLGHVPVLLAR